jgi:hypothetical protein
MTNAELQAVVDEFLKDGLANHNEELEFFENQPSLRRAVEVAATGKDQWGKMFKHQCRVGSAALAVARPNVLALVPEFEKCETFSEIHSLVRHATRNVLRIGDLANYDPALRIGAKKGLLPTDVFLHCGSLEGARNLGLPCEGGRISKDRLPPAMKSLSASQAENFLCRKKDKLSPLE